MSALNAATDATVVTVESSATSSSLFHQRVARREGGIVTYGMTPPKLTTEVSKLPTLADTQRQRLISVPADAVILYDIHDEKDRATEIPRPFPFSETLNGLDWAEQLGDVGKPYVHFRCIAKYDAPEFEAQLKDRLPVNNNAVVVVGGAAAAQQLPITMDQAYEIRRTVAPELFVGAVAIAERHAAKGNEHERMLQKQTVGGVSFFVTQCVYNLEEAKNLLSDYASTCKKQGIPMVPILVTITPCGSAKTLEFLGWLGVKVSKWLENDLRDAADQGLILEESVDALLHLFKELLHFARKKGIPLGCNVESVAVRKVEIEASIRLATEIKKILEQEDSGAAATVNPATHII